ncbi:TonB-dependent receptor [Bacteroidales bacterium OttesenSCG-928-M11]|nr:TonB-dependent receptor [Bacteroidales bacterium OttesenSCG-928-M11]
MKHKMLKKKAAYRFRRFARKAYAAFNSMHKEVSIGVVTASMLVFAGITESAAQSQMTLIPDSIPDLELEEVVVSSSIADLTLGRIAQPAVIISSKEVERQPVQSVQDLLKPIAALDIRQRGPNGVLAGISIRGGTFEQTAVLLNGANLSNPQTAHYSLDIPINLSDIERIEVIQGPSSLLFGASAFSGGINIITKNNKKSDRLFATAEAGMYGLLSGSARGAFQAGETSHSLSIGFSRSDGYCNNSDYDLFNTLWQSEWQSDEASLLFNFGVNDKSYGANTFYSAAYPNQYDDTRSYFATLRGETNGRIKFTPQLYWSRHDDDFYLVRGASPNVHQTDVYGLSLNGQYTFGLGPLNFGGEIRQEGIVSSVLGNDNRTNTSYFINQTILLDRFTFTAGLLANHNTFVGTDFELFPNIGISYQIQNGFRLFSSWNTATRMPTFTDLYYTSPTHTGNSDLKPERSSSFELGSKYSTRFVSAQLSGFYFHGKNMIDWVKDKPDDLWRSANFTEIDKFGVEATLSTKVRHTDFSVAFLWMTQSKDASGLISNYALDYLRYKLTASLSHPIYRSLTANWQFRWQKREGTFTQYEALKPSYEREYPAFALLDLKLNYQLDKLGVFLAINNLFDTDYYDLGNIPQPGFWFTAGINWRLQ